jgi:hypothetical protein
MSSSVSLSEWIAYVFDQKVSDPAWHFGLDAPELRLESQRAAQLIGETFENAGQLLSVFSDAQLNQAFWFLVSSGNSDYMYSLNDQTVPWPTRRRALRSIVPLFEQVMAKRCPPVLSHLDEPGASALNSACYMWWDIAPISESAQSEDPFAIEVLDVMAAILAIPNDACRESALHGLGHWAHRHRQARAIIDDFLSKHSGLRAELVRYANAARTGCIQ